MFKTEELKKIWLGKTFHWSTKVRILEKYHKTKKEEDPYWSESKTAYELNITKTAVWEALRLAAMIREFPTIAKLPTKQKAMGLIQKYYSQPVAELRKAINVIAVKYKSTEHYHRLRRELMSEGIDPDDTAKKDSDNKKLEFADIPNSELKVRPENFSWRSDKKRNG